MPRFSKRFSTTVIIVISILLIALIIYTTGIRKDITVAESFLGRITLPFQRVIYGAANSVGNFFSGFNERQNLKENYKKLKEHVTELENDVILMEELKKQNERMRELLQFTERKQQITVTGAKVIGKNPGNWFNVITIDKGENDGVKENMAVVTNKGLVGRVFQTASSWAKVRTIVDSQSSVSGIIQRNRDNGSVKGNNSLNSGQGLCRMIYLPEDSNVLAGDKVITSGLGGIFPKGIYIGEVIDVAKNKRDLFKTAIVKPAVDFQRLEEVLVIESGDLDK